MVLFPIQLLKNKRPGGAGPKNSYKRTALRRIGKAVDNASRLRG
jgi:hypothetical protein